MTGFALMMLGALLIDAVLGWPARLFQRIGHPVTWIGAAIDRMERALNLGTRRRRIGSGALCLLGVIGLAGIPAALVQAILPGGLWGVLIGAALAWPLVASRSLDEHVRAVAEPLAQGDLDAARGAVAMIVGRDPSQLDAPGVARAAIESLAENTSDGIVAPLFWGVVAGLPGIAIYKAINTADSMIGHRNARYEAFGKVAARVDDVVNWVPARITGALFALASGRMAQTAWRVMMQDARAHRSPNAGWPEGAMAGALGIRLSGPRRYAERVAQEPWVNAGAPDPEPRTTMDALSLFHRCMVALGLALALIAVVQGLL